MWHGLAAREITAKMAVPPIKQLRLNTYKPKAFGMVPPSLSTGLSENPTFL